MDRFLVAFERPSDVSNISIEEAWDHWSDDLRAFGFELVADLDPVDTVGNIEIYEVTRR